MEPNGLKAACHANPHSRIAPGHGIQHDILQLNPLAEGRKTDNQTDARYLEFILNHRAVTEPTMEYYGRYTARFAFKAYRAIDWTHMHHKQTYDILAEKSIPW